MLQADRAFSSKQGGSWSPRPTHRRSPARRTICRRIPGSWSRQRSLSFRGAAMIEYWQWHPALRHRDVLGRSAPHSQQPGRVYREVTELGRRLARLGPVLEGYEPDAEVAILWSTDTRFAFEYQPPLADETGTRCSPTTGIFEASYAASSTPVPRARAACRTGRAAGRCRARTPSRCWSRRPSTSPPTPSCSFSRLRRGGGHLIVGIRTGYGDEEARPFAIAPDVLNKPAGVWYEEFSNLAAPLELDAAAPLTLTPAAHATRWADGLLADGADVLARYRHREFGRFAAITTQHGDGRITVLGTVPNPALGAQLMRWAVPEPIAAGWSIVGSPVRVSSGRADRRRACGSCTTGRAATPR